MSLKFHVRSNLITKGSHAPTTGFYANNLKASPYITWVFSDPEDEDGSDNSSSKLQPRLHSAKVTHAKYPFFVPPNKKDELAPDALNDVVTYETEVDLLIKTPYFDLQVPAQSKLLGYNIHEIHLGYDYVEPVLARELRTGAEVCNRFLLLGI